MNKIYYLSTCSTCQRIISELRLPKDFIFQDIKTDKITPQQLEDMQNIAGSYENLFSRNALKYRVLGLGEKNLGEKDYRKYILEEYTFLKRPVIIIGKEIFIGNAPKVIEEARKALAKL